MRYSMPNILRALIAAGLLLVAAPALAQSTATPVVTGYLTTVGCPYGQTTCFVQYGAGGPIGPVSIAPTGANVSVTPTIQNASYVSGNCMGGFQTVSLGTSQSVLSQIELSSKGGLATAKVLYVFFANPSASTCTDKGTFTLAAADVSKKMGVFTITPTARTGTTVTDGLANNLALGIPSGGVVYVAIVETTTETPASTSDLVLNFSAF